MFYKLYITTLNVLGNMRGSINYMIPARDPKQLDEHNFI
jgi:hypothetical protein